MDGHTLTARVHLGGLFSRCFPAGWQTLLLLGVVLLSGLAAFSQPDASPSYEERQRQFFREAIRTPGISDRFETELQLYLNESTLTANSTIVSSPWTPETILEGTRIIRLAMQWEGETRLHADTRRQLLLEWETLLETLEQRFFGEVQGHYFPEHFDLYTHTVLLLWAQVNQQQERLYEWPGGGTHAERFEQHRAGVRTWLHERVRYGLRERGSFFTPHTMIALLLLVDFADGEEIQTLARMVLDQIVADYALFSIGSSMGGARIRAMESLGAIEGQGIALILLGQLELMDERIMTNPVGLHLAASRYQPPPVLEALIREPVERGIFEDWSRYSRSRSGDRDGLGRRYTYVSPRLVFSSFQLRNEEVPWQSRPWDLLVRSENGQAFRMFAFAGRQLFSGGRPPYAGEYFHWNADVFQHQNVLLFRFLRNDRKRSDRTPAERLQPRYVQWPTRIWFSEGFQPVMEEEGWWFCQHQGVYIALRPLVGRAYWWRSVQTASPDTPDASILAMQNLTTPVLIEVEQADRFRSFEGFREQIINAPLTVENNQVSYVSRKGDVILFPLDGSDMLVNGRTVDPWTNPRYQLFTNPFVRSVYGSGILEARWPPWTLVHQLNDDELPVRKIGP